MATINRVCVNGVYYDFERPEGSVRYGIGTKENLPKDAIQVEIYMRSGDPQAVCSPERRFGKTGVPLLKVGRYN